MSDNKNDYKSDIETLNGMAALCRLMIAWSEREPDAFLPDPLGACDKEEPPQ